MARKGVKPLASGSFERIGTRAAYFALDADDHYSESVPVADHRQALRTLIDYLHRNSHISALLDIHAVIHRISHGDEMFEGAVLLHRDDIHRLERISHLSPGGRAAAMLVAAGMSQLPSASHVGVFDTAAHMPPESAAYPIDQTLARRFGLRRYAFQAIMHRGARESLRKPARRVITVVIDDDVSVAAALDGVIIESTTGFTQAEGIPGLRRSGSLDPRIPLYLATHLRMGPQQVDALLSGKSGIGAMAGKRTYDEIVKACRKRESAAINALMLLSSRLSYAIAGMSTALGGVDAIVFCGKGASWMLIEDACGRLSHLGVTLSPERRTGILSAPRSRVAVMHAGIDETSIILADAKDVISRHASRMFKNSGRLRRRR